MKNPENKTTYHAPAGGGCVFCLCGIVPCKYTEPEKWREWLSPRLKENDNGHRDSQATR